MAKTKAFKTTQNNQYIQEINLNAGEYTFSANIRADSASIIVCKFSLLVGDVWLEYDLTDQIYIGQFQKVKKVIQLNDKATKLSLISSGSGGGRIFHVDRPMFEGYNDYCEKCKQITREGLRIKQ